MNAREAILARVREALTVPGPGPHQRAGELSGHGATTHTAPPPRGSLPVLALSWHQYRQSGPQCPLRPH